MTALYGLFPDPDSAQSAVDRLQAEGLARGEITIVSSEPFEDHAFSRGDKATWMFWIAGAGGALGLAFGYWLTRMTELSWPLQTGGMPIVAHWPNLIIMFELTMLAAVLSTVATLLVTAQLPRRRPPLYDPAVSDGKILVGVERSRLSEEVLKRALEESGGQVKALS